MTEPPPSFRHRPERRGLVGPFSGRQLLAAFATIVVVFIVLVAVTTPLGGTADPGLDDPRATAFVIGPATEGLRPGDRPPEFTIELDDGGTYQLTDLDGRPIRLADLAGKGVWINFFATWCPPCQGEVPILRGLSSRYRERGLEVVAVSVQETQASDVAAYAERYELEFTIGFDASGHVLRTYRVNALPTQFFVTPDGVIRDVVIGPLDEAGATARIERILPAAVPSPTP